ncbi:hypothetical protein CYJ65_06940 [Gardnerella vaginalis]|nr:hypothetical protein CYJ63_02990 [Gardnerella vaginalis]PKZ74934.1 hypothetical protein CYJ65_06940 [Gardnerella vaginalis]
MLYAYILFTLFALCILIILLDCFARHSRVLCFLWFFVCFLGCFWVVFGFVLVVVVVCCGFLRVFDTPMFWLVFNGFVVFVWCWFAFWWGLV